MKWFAFLLLLVALGDPSLLHAQTYSDSLHIYETRSGMKFTLNKKVLTMPELMNTLRDYQPAYDEMRSAKRNKISVVTGFIGGFLIGWPLGNLIAGEKPQWIMAGIGAGVIGLTIPLDKAYKKHAKKAIALYNAHL
jgi:hypothetical protein